MADEIARYDKRSCCVMLDFPLSRVVARLKSWFICGLLVMMLSDLEISRVNRVHRERYTQ